MAIAVAAIVVAAIGCPGVARADPYQTVVLRALDKVTARSVTLEVPIDTPVTFRTLEITAHVCDKRPPEESPEAASYLDIVEKREGRPPVIVFRGWMFASSPGLSAMQHPVYDIWVLDCVNKVESAPSQPAESDGTTNDALTGNASSNK
ncbi:DUF2155 domain-containing protein [Defluviicoccus vanus]|uniref:DUF2155 domain-containing protein n=1 Tax=Defluviicoccus vanus TaxID=111831 RepID=UPI001CBA63FB|nr:DUF2155 domain-containing protein [Defluviicoccus vanus]